MSTEFSGDEFDRKDPGERRRILDETGERLKQQALIEQAKGIVMFVYGIDADAAFDVLRIQSDEHGVVLVDLAEQILKDMVRLGQSRGPASRVGDGFILTAHHRIIEGAARQLAASQRTNA